MWESTGIHLSARGALEDEPILEYTKARARVRFRLTHRYLRRGKEVATHFTFMATGKLAEHIAITYRAGSWIEIVRAVPRRWQFGERNMAVWMVEELVSTDPPDAKPSKAAKTYETYEAADPSTYVSPCQPEYLDAVPQGTNAYALIPPSGMLGTTEQGGKG